MVYIYREVMVSGTLPDKEGVSDGLEKISTFMQDCGWTLVDDRSAEPGTAVPATHMKYVFSSNGEDGSYPTFFVTLYSGTAAAVNSDVMGHQVHTAYDVGAHDVPASGVVSDTAIGYASSSLNIESQSENVKLYMAGDSEMVHIVSQRETTKNNTTMDNVYFGRFNSFAPLEESPYPLIAHGANNTICTSNTNARGIGGNPPQAFNANNEMSTLAMGITDTMQPYDIGDITSIFFAQPILVAYVDTTPKRSDIAGTVRHGWRGADATRLLNLSILTASGTFGEQTYRAFNPYTGTSVPSLILRKT